ncbi:MAG: cytosine permease [Acetobacter sp.]|uniref:purine-cytosine permease family protein n=1 Tax=Acetobacter sp. TaxID=440 RepID=UPI0039E962A9
MNVGADRILHIEQLGARPIPEDARYGRPSDLLGIFFGAQIGFPSLVLGAVPVAFGLGPGRSLLCIAIGSLLGALAVGAMALMGPITGTNNIVSSSAFFGQRGKILGSIIVMIMDLGYFALGFWITTPQFEILFRFLGWSVDHWVLLSCAVLAQLLIILCALLGHATVVAYEKSVSLVGTACMACVVLHIWLWPTGAPRFDGLYPAGGLWIACLASIATHFGNAVSYAPFAGDYTRYFPRNSSRLAVFSYAVAGMFTGCMIACGAGVVIGLSISQPLQLVPQMLAAVPQWLVLPLVAAGLAGHVCNGSMVSYNGILNMQAVMKGMGRPTVAIVYGLCGTVLGMLGLMVMNLTESLMAMCAIVNIFVVPWICINIVGFLKIILSESYKFEKLPGPSRYISPGAFVIWLVSIICGLPFSANGLFIGTAARLFGGSDLGFVMSGLVAGLLYAFFGKPEEYAS